MTRRVFEVKLCLKGLVERALTGRLKEAEYEKPHVAAPILLAKRSQRRTSKPRLKPAPNPPFDCGRIADLKRAPVGAHSD
jgi:hypothetical protein